MSKKWIALLALLWLIFWMTPGLAATTVEMTWMSIANWYFKIGEKRIMMDAYISRVPGPPFFYPPPGLSRRPVRLHQERLRS
jgi:L-ascorbate metabolism protein UlaG (beta-lactamase superfamily)